MKETTNIEKSKLIATERIIYMRFNTCIQKDKLQLCNRNRLTQRVELQCQSSTGNITNRSSVEKVFLPWSKANKRSWRHDEFRTRAICEFFGGKTFREISPLFVERFKRERRESITRRGSVRSPASVNHELELLSKIFNLAID